MSDLALSLGASISTKDDSNNTFGIATYDFLSVTNRKSYMTNP